MHVQPFDLSKLSRIRWSKLKHILWGLGLFASMPSLASAQAPESRPGLSLPSQQPQIEEAVVQHSDHKQADGLKGAVIAHDSTWALIEFEGELQKDDRLDFFENIPVERFSLGTSFGETFAVEKQRGSGVVQAISGDNAWLRLERGAIPKSGNFLRRKPQSSTGAYPWAPERIGGVTELDFILRPMLVVNELGFGLMLDATAVHRFDAPWYIGASLMPLGIGTSQLATTTTANFLVFGGFDHRYFSVGLGGGIATVDQHIGQSTLSSPRAGIVFAQQLRVGARAGIHVEATTSFVVAPKDEYVNVSPCPNDGSFGDFAPPPSCVVRREAEDQGFKFRDVRLKFSVPAGQRMDILLNTTIPGVSPFLIELVTSIWMRGRGGAGSIALNIGAGFADMTHSNGRIDRTPGSSEVQHLGPLVSGGVRWVL